MGEAAMELTGSPSIEEAVREAAERRARAANARDLWDGIWKREGEDSWRQHALERVYKRITKLLSKGTGRGLTYGPVYDVGGGAGLLAAQIAAKGLWTVVWDHSESALRIAQDAGIETLNVDLEAEANPPRFLVAESHPAVVATEVLEHLSDRARRRLLAAASEEAGCAIFSVPNNRLGPDEEPQHTIKWTALEFLTLLREFWGKRCRVEVMGPFLLGVCGDLADKPYTLSVTFPARDEAADIEATLASFRGIADEMVIGIDYRTKDNTEEIARRYAEKVFIIDDPQGPPDDQAPQVHFSHCRNRCIRECSGDWIFMTEAHERLGKGQDILLHLDEALPERRRVSRGLEDDRVARDQRGRDLPRGDRDREVPRRDDADDADRHPDGHLELVLELGRCRLADEPPTLSAHVVAHVDRFLDVAAGQAVLTTRGERVRYETPAPEGADYLSVCLPAFAPATVHRD